MRVKAVVVCVIHFYWVSCKITHWVILPCPIQVDYRSVSLLFFKKKRKFYARFKENDISHRVNPEGGYQSCRLWRLYKTNVCGDKKVSESWWGGYIVILEKLRFERFYTVRVIKLLDENRESRRKLSSFSELLIVSSRIDNIDSIPIWIGVALIDDWTVLDSVGTCLSRGIRTIQIHPFTGLGLIWLSVWRTVEKVVKRSRGLRTLNGRHFYIFWQVVLAFCESFLAKVELMWVKSKSKIYFNILQNLTIWHKSRFMIILRALTFFWI